jgi:hypothetical protein
MFIMCLIHLANITPYIRCYLKFCCYEITVDIFLALECIFWLHMFMLILIRIAAHVRVASKKSCTIFRCLHMY